MTREVTEMDFRCPEFRNAKVADYEFRDDGALVRKDRWEMGIRAIVSILEMSRDDFEISDIVERVRDMEMGFRAIEGQTFSEEE